MSVKHLVAKAATIAAGAALALSTVSTTANAASANISAWTSNGTACHSYFTMCLFYSPNATGGTWGTKYAAEGSLDFTFTGGAGDGHVVWRDAASADNNTDCNVGIWNGYNFTGDSDWLSPHKGGNLGPMLRNHEQSMAVDDSTHCRGIGIG